MPGQPVVLDTLGGLVATCRPEDVPEGASPRTFDTDYIVGRVIQRAGLQSIYSYAAANTYGPNGGGTATDLNDQGNPWVNPNNILLSDGSFTDSTAVSPLVTDTLYVTNFNFTVPSSVSIQGILVAVKGYAPGTTVYAQLLKGGVPVGDIYPSVLPTVNASVYFGSDSALWGVTWDYSEIDATGFGVALWAECTAPATVALDYCSIKVY